MIPCLVIGARGFLGGNLLAHLEGLGVNARGATRETPIESLETTPYGTVCYCAGNSKTYLAARAPLRALDDDVTALHRYLTRLQFDKWLHISSSVVYPPRLIVKSEDAPLPIHELSLYAAHKLLAERYVTVLARRWVILRPTGFFGPGLRKNLLFDLRSGGRDVYLQRASVLDYLPVERFSAIAWQLAERAENEIVNVGSGHPRRLEEILAIKPSNGYVFHEERLVDDRGLSLQRLRRHCGDPISEVELDTALRAWLLGPADGATPTPAGPSAITSAKAGPRG